MRPGVDRCPAPGLTALALRTPTLPPATTTNAWLLDDGAGGVVVVDPASPWPGERARLLAHLDGRTVRAVVLTHHHHDHVAGAREVADALGAPLLAHPETAARLPFGVDGTLRDGDELGGWRVLATPGHAPGHLCLERGGLVVAGDLVAGEGTVLLDPDDGADLGAYLDSLARVRALGPRLLAPAHGPALEPAVAAIDALVAHRHGRTRRIAAALRAGRARPADIVPLVYDDVPRAAWPLAERQVRAHLDWLVARGEAARDGAGYRWTGGEASMSDEERRDDHERPDGGAGAEPRDGGPAPGSEFEEGIEHLARAVEGVFTRLLGERVTGAPADRPALGPEADRALEQTAEAVGRLLHAAGRGLEHHPGRPDRALAEIPRLMEEPVPAAEGETALTAGLRALARGISRVAEAAVDAVAPRGED